MSEQSASLPVLSLVVMSIGISAQLQPPWRPNRVTKRDMCEFVCCALLSFNDKAARLASIIVGISSPLSGLYRQLFTCFSIIICVRAT